MEALLKKWMNCYFMCTYQWKILCNNSSSRVHTNNSKTLLKFILILHSSNYIPGPAWVPSIVNSACWLHTAPARPLPVSITLTPPVPPSARPEIGL